MSRRQESISRRERERKRRGREGAQRGLAKEWWGNGREGWGGKEAGRKRREGGKGGGGGRKEDAKKAGRDLAAFRTTTTPSASCLSGADVSILNLHIAQVCMHGAHASTGLHRVLGVGFRVQSLGFMTCHQSSTGKVSLTRHSRLPILGFKVYTFCKDCDVGQGLGAGEGTLRT